MFEGIIERWRTQIDALVKSGLWATIALCALAAAFVFFGAAVFVVAQAEFGTVPTFFGFAGFFLVIALIAVIVLGVIRRRAERRQAEIARAAAKARPQWWADPAVMSAGLELSKTLGARRAIAIGVVAFLIGLLISRNIDKT